MLTLLVAFLVAFTALLYGVCRSCLFFGRHASVIRVPGIACLVPAATLAVTGLCR
jgi:hypothetical protein